MSFAYNPFTGQFERKSAVVSGGSGSLQTEYITLSSGQIAAKSVTLATAPAVPSMVTVDVVGGCIQNYGADFTVAGTTLTWNGLGMETILAAGDVLVINY